MRVEDSSVPVVALKMFCHCGPGMMRSLGRLGIKVYGIDAHPDNPAFSSRYCRGRHIWDAESEDPERTVSFLHDLARSMKEKPILITNGDVISLLVADYAAELRDAFSFRLPDGKLARSLSNKWEMYRLAKDHGVSTPETLLPRSREEVEEFLDSGAGKLPLMIKGADSALLEKNTGVRMALARSQREVLEMYDRLVDPAQPNLMLQEYIPGADDTIWMLDAYFNADSECLTCMVGRKIRQSPAYTGMTSLGVLLRNKPLEETTKRFMKRVGYQGIVDMGYRFDARDGEFKLLDINPRIGATFRLFQDRKGLDVLRAYYLDLTGQAVRQDEISEGRKWVVENNDFISYFQYRRDGKITFWKWMKSFRGVREGAWFAWDDPVPFLLMLKEVFLQGWRKIGRKVRAVTSERQVSAIPSPQPPI
jgi:D-aspartate ligase